MKGATESLDVLGGPASIQIVKIYASRPSSAGSYRIALEASRAALERDRSLFEMQKLRPRPLSCWLRIAPPKLCRSVSGRWPLLNACSIRTTRFSVCWSWRPVFPPTKQQFRDSRAALFARSRAVVSLGTRSSANAESQE